MEIVHNLNTHSSQLSTIRGGKRLSDALQSAEKELLLQMAEAFTIINGGQIKRRRQTA